MKNKILMWFSKNALTLLYLAVTAVVTVIELITLQFHPTYEFGFTVLAFVVIILKLGLCIFDKGRKNTLLCIGCGAINVIIINRLFVYERLIEAFPLLAGISQWVIFASAAGTALVTILLVRFVIWLINRPYEGPEKVVVPNKKGSSTIYYTTQTSNIDASIPISADAQVQKNQPTMNNNPNNSTDQQKDSRLRGIDDLLFSIALLVVVLFIVAVSVYYLVSNSYSDTAAAIKEGLPDTFVVLLEYVVLVFAVLLVVMALIAVSIEFVRFNRERTRAMRNLQNGKEVKLPSVPTNVLSISIVLVIFALMYFNKDFKMDDFFNLTAAGDYLAIPLELMVMLGVFLFLSLCVNWFLKALLEPHSKDEDSSYYTIDLVKHEIICIIKDVIELVLNTIKAAIKFAGFIPDFFTTIYDFVFVDETSVCEKSDNPDTADTGDIDAEISQRNNELKKKQVDEITAQDNYKNAQNDYEALYGERYVRPVEFKEIQDRRDELREELGEATKEVTDLENMISDLEKEKRDLENSPNMKSMEFLTMFLETNPSPNKLQECINELQSMVIDMQDGSIVPTNLANIVRKIRALSITIEDYSALKGNGNKSAEEILDSLRESYAEGISAPDPKSEYFETERKKWKKEWTEKYEKLQRLIRSLPRYHESGAEEKLVNAQIDTTILTSFDPDGKEDEINTMIREKLSDINVMERASSLLFSKYRFSAIFSACLAFYLDIVSLLCGLFSYYLKRNQKMKADT